MSTAQISDARILDAQMLSCTYVCTYCIRWSMYMLWKDERQLFFYFSEFLFKIEARDSGVGDVASSDSFGSSDPSKVCRAPKGRERDVDVQVFQNILMRWRRRRRRGRRGGQGRGKGVLGWLLLLLSKRCCVYKRHRR